MNKPFNSRSSIRKEEHNNDTFITPKNAIIPLIDALGIQDGDRIYDCCCGHGDNHHRIGKVIAEHKDITYDGFDLVQDGIEVYPHKYSRKNVVPSIRDNKEPSNYVPDDIYIKIYEQTDWLISNPPYGRHPEGGILKHLFIDFYLDTVSDADQIKGVALLLPITTLAGKSYSELYKKYGYPSLLLFTSRVQFIAEKQSNVDVAWFIWKRDEQPFMKHVDLIKQKKGD